MHVSTTSHVFFPLNDTWVSLNFFFFFGSIFFVFVSKYRQLSSATLLTNNLEHLLHLKEISHWIGIYLSFDVVAYCAEA